MIKSLPADSPNLQLAVSRLRRTLWIWAALMGATGGLTLLTQGSEHPLLAVPWLATAALMLLGRQPAYLALTAMVWGLSLIQFVPGVRQVFGADPLSPLIGNTAVETVALILVRGLLMVTAWSQFFLYRWLYGTESATGLDPGLPPIPEMIPNRTDLLAQLGRALGSLAVLAAFAAAATGSTMAGARLLEASLAMAILGLGLGLGVAFSPTSRRGAALLGTGLSISAYLMSLAFGRWLTFGP